MTRWLRNRKRWAARRALILHERTLLRCYDDLAALEGRKQARLAALPVHLRMLLEVEMARPVPQPDTGEAMLLAQIGALR